MGTSSKRVTICVQNRGPLRPYRRATPSRCASSHAGQPRAVHPFEVVFALVLFVKAPGELAHTNDVDAGSHHQFSVPLPARFGLFRCPRVRIDPMFGIVVSAEIHSTKA